jgi:hypothetical protein
LTERSNYVPEFENLLGHMKHHKVKEWLLRGATDEDARTIGNAIACCSESKIRRALALILTQEK